MAAGAPTSVAVEVEFTAGAWTAVTTAVVGESLEIKVGRERGGDPQPGTLKFDLDNADGTYTPDNPLSSLYPNLVEGKRVRVVVVKGAATSYRFVGWISTLEPELGQSPNQSVTHVEAIDLLGVLARMEPGSVPEAYALANSSVSILYPCSELDLYQAGASDIKGGTRARLVVWDKDPSGGSVESASDSVAGNASYAKLTAGKGLWTVTGAFPAMDSGASDAWSLSFVCKPESYTANPDGVIWLSAGKLGTYTQAVGLGFYADAGFLTQYRGSGGTTIVSGSYRPDIAQLGRWYHVTLTSDGAGSGSLKVNGETVVSSIPVVGGLTDIAIAGNSDLSIGAVALSIGSTVEPHPARAALGAEAYGGATVSDIGDDVAFAANLTALGAGFVQAAGTDPQSTTASGTTALEMFLALARGQGGVLFHDYTSADPQQVRIVPRNLTRPSTVALTLDAEADLDGPPVLLREVGGLASSAKASSTGREAVATDDSVAARVGAVTVEVESTLYDLVELEGQASDALAETRDQVLRVSQVTVDLWTATNDLYSAWFSTDVGSRVRVGNLASTYLGVTYIDGYVAGWTERPMLTGYPVTIDLASAPYAEAVADTARAGWGDGVCTASSLTSSGTSVTLTWTGTQTLSTSAGDYPLDINIGGERCTISSAPAGGTSPRTVTIVRGVAPTVARAHAANDPVEMWDAARVAF